MRSKQPVSGDSGRQIAASRTRWLRGLLAGTVVAVALAACTDVRTVVSPPVATTPETEIEPTEPPAEVDAGAEPPDANVAPAVGGPSCAAGGGAGTKDDCGKGASCCASSVVPGGTFYRWKNRAVSDPQDEQPATVSAFTLDLFEVTVGRFRRFVDAGGGTRQHPPKQGSGAHPKIPSSGWKSAWNVLLPEDRIALDTALVAEKPVTIWTQSEGPNETKPMKGIGYALAFAFCAWDGGRLPTLAEWNFAAAGGDEHRTFPWGDTIGRRHAVYDCRNEGADKGCDPSDLPSVGSKPAGVSRWGQFDLVGSVREWALDSDPDLVPCKDCGIVDPTGNWTALMGGSFWSPEIGDVTAGALTLMQHPTADFDAGVRCARDIGRTK